MRQSFTTRFGLAFISLILSGLVAGVVLYLILLYQLPNVEPLKHVAMQAPMQIFTREGQLLGEYGEKQRIPIKLAAVPPLFIQALLATEDQRFYLHNGVDVFGLARAVKHLVATGEKGQGASTITMQVARNFYLSREKTFSRKLREMLLAIKIEHHLSKAEILSLYINKIYFGHRAYGIAAAARNYYGKPIGELTVAELAMLAGLPQAPSRHNPLRNPQSAMKRRNHVLRRLYEEHQLTSVAYLAALGAPITASPHRLKLSVSAGYIDEYVRRKVVARYGPQMAYSSGLKVITTINQAAQKEAHQALRHGILRYDQHHGWRKPAKLPLVLSLRALRHAWAHFPVDPLLKPLWVTRVTSEGITGFLVSGEQIHLSGQSASWATYWVKKGYRLGTPFHLTALIHPNDVVYVQPERDHWRLSQWPRVSAALVAVDPHNGAIIAMQGGFNSHVQQFNYATQAWRQPGSVLKPFIYSAALAKGLTLASVINDAPVVVADGGENLLWRPQNDNRHFHGPTRLREGLIHSTNLVSIRLLRLIGLDYTRDFISRFGFDLARHPKSLSLALGSGEVTPLQVASAYGVFANQGLRAEPFIIQRIIQGDKVLYDHLLNDHSPYRPLGHRVLTRRQAFLMHTALQDVIRRGTGRQAKQLNRLDIVGKTGTTNDRKDAWFAGYHPHLATSVWFGFDDNQSLYGYGAQVALPVWIEFMRARLKTLPILSMQAPKGILKAWINPKTGLLAKETSQALLEYFRLEHMPNIMRS